MNNKNKGKKDTFSMIWNRIDGNTFNYTYSDVPDLGTVYCRQFSKRLVLPSAADATQTLSTNWLQIKYIKNIIRGFKGTLNI